METTTKVTFNRELIDIIGLIAAAKYSDSVEAMAVNSMVSAMAVEFLCKEPADELVAYWRTRLALALDSFEAIR